MGETPAEAATCRCGHTREQHSNGDLPTNIVGAKWLNIVHPTMCLAREASGAICGCIQFERSEVFHG